MWRDGSDAGGQSVKIKSTPSVAMGQRMWNIIGLDEIQPLSTHGLGRGLEGMTGTLSPSLALSQGVLLIGVESWHNSFLVLAASYDDERLRIRSLPCISPCLDLETPSSSHERISPLAWHTIRTSHLWTVGLESTRVLINVKCSYEAAWRPITRCNGELEGPE
ncbi:unnamed protein product [Blumeria hordei]|uniref:Uncharacterized protein n=1 Tax=Blumeria hordei TaxID=2867405 RepID=A0A383UL91_BLUHO|nr:unnamed protein product [Blumeria hordei]